MLVSQLNLNLLSDSIQFLLLFLNLFDLLHIVFLSKSERFLNDFCNDSIVINFNIISFLLLKKSFSVNNIVSIGLFLLYLAFLAHFEFQVVLKDIRGGPKSIFHIVCIFNIGKPNPFHAIVTSKVVDWYNFIINFFLPRNLLFFASQNLRNKHFGEVRLLVYRVDIPYKIQFVAEFGGDEWVDRIIPITVKE